MGTIKGENTKGETGSSSEREISDIGRESALRRGRKERERCEKERGEPNNRDREERENRRERSRVFESYWTE